MAKQKAEQKSPTPSPEGKAKVQEYKAMAKAEQARLLEECKQKIKAVCDEYGLTLGARPYFGERGETLAEPVLVTPQQEA